MQSIAEDRAKIKAFRSRKTKAKLRLIPGTKSIEQIEADEIKDDAIYCLNIAYINLKKGLDALTPEQLVDEEVKERLWFIRDVLNI